MLFQKIDLIKTTWLKWERLTGLHGFSPQLCLTFHPYLQALHEKFLTFVTLSDSPKCCQGQKENFANTNHWQNWEGSKMDWFSQATHFWIISLPYRHLSLYGLSFKAKKHLLPGNNLISGIYSQLWLLGQWHFRYQQEKERIYILNTQKNFTCIIHRNNAKVDHFCLLRTVLRSSVCEMNRLLNG